MPSLTPAPSSNGLVADDADDGPPTTPRTASAHCDGVVATSATSTSTSARPLAVDARKSPTRRARAVRGVAASHRSGAASASEEKADVACPLPAVAPRPDGGPSALPGVDGTLAGVIARSIRPLRISKTCARASRGAVA